MSFLRFVLAAALMLCGAQFAGAQTFPPLTGRVVDDAHLLSAPQIAQLTQLSEDIEKASSRQFVVATIPDLQGHEIEDYGYQLGRAWKIGQGGANNGIILIVAPKERKVRIEVGYGLEPIMTDALSSVIINETILPKFKAGDMPGGIIAGANAIADQMKLPLEAGEARAAKLAATPKRSQSSASGIPFVVIFWIIVIAFVVLSRFRRGTSGRRYRGGIAPVTLWGSGLGSGWGSGWGSGGGGGGGFSGGGGSFGGGGASGGW
ncbi:hypothetical protein GCM10009087_03740 [Sphingomonas oligophenolica]|uniref:TPM domain-containing protein n=1 Tax=Sphingomonas oligophenolica TaxID=301154 RepID=A0ABU9Y629_9SPHN